ncbi:MAG TPA: hypothetical protein VF042_15660 [Gemmatimonadaceae bacterium]
MRTRFNCVALMLAIGAVSVTAVGCSPDSTSPISASSARAVGEPSSSAAEQTAWMGKYHNDALDFALKKIKASKRTAKLDRCRVGIAALKDFQKEYGKRTGSPFFSDLTLSDGACERAAAQISGSVSQSVMLNNPLLRYDISYAAENYMNQIVSQVDYATSALTLSFAVNRIVRQASSTVDAVEATAVAGSGSITTSSASYWESNESSWAEPNQVQYDRMSSGIERIDVAPANLSGRTKAIIRADAVAGVSTLLSQWFMGEAALASAAIRAAAASLAAGIFYTT